jgi:hypothetical protein
MARVWSSLGRVRRSGRLRIHGQSLALKRGGRTSVTNGGDSGANLGSSRCVVEWPGNEAQLYARRASMFS